MRLLPIFVILLLIWSQVFAQKSYWGDKTNIAKIDSIASYIYEHADTTIHLLSNFQFQKTPSHGCQIHISVKDKRVNKVVISANKVKGILAHELYIDNGKIVFVYQTFGYYSEQKTQSQFVNFLGHRGWESRFYFEDNQLVYYENEGVKELNDEYRIEDFNAEKNNIIKYLSLN